MSCVEEGTCMSCVEESPCTSCSGGHLDGRLVVCRIRLDTPVAPVNQRRAVRAGIPEQGKLQQHCPLNSAPRSLKG